MTTDPVRSKRRLCLAHPLVMAMCVFIACAGAPSFADEHSQRFLERESVRSYLSNFGKEHGLSVHRLAGMFSRLSSQQSILDAISRPAERTLTWREYRPIFLTQKRINDGKRFLAQYTDVLQQAEAEYGVPAEIITAIIGVETSYGRITGSYRVLEALATLAFDYPPRAKFFASELDEFILLSELEGWDAVEVKGSYAGAMGMPQFISSSYREYAIDFDGDGTRDLFNSHADIIGSVANYLDRHGWVKSAPIAERWQLQDQEAKSAAQKLVRSSLRPAIGADTVRALGFDTPALEKATAPNRLISVMTMQGSDAEEYWVGYRNFYAITRYNHSRLYAMAVFQLAQAIRSSS